MNCYSYLYLDVEKSRMSSFSTFPPHSFLFETCIFAEGQVLPSSQGLTLYLCFLVSLCIKLFFGPFSLKLHPDGFLFVELPTLPNWKAFTKRLVSPSLVASEASLLPLRVTLTHFAPSSYERALLCHFMFGQTYSETKTF